MRSFNGDFPPWRCSGRHRRRGERRRHSLGNKTWKKELHHQECALDKKLGDDALMEEKKERRGEHEIEGIKYGEKWNFEVMEYLVFPKKFVDEGGIVDVVHSSRVFKFLNML